MNYLKEAVRLSQSQAIENLNAVLSSDYFRDYEFYPDVNEIVSNVIGIDSIGLGREQPYKVKEIGDIVVGLLDAVKNRGILNKVFIKITPPKDTVQTMQFEAAGETDDKLDISLPITFSVSQEKFGSDEYYFCVLQSGLGGVKDAEKKLARWYQEIDKTLKEILPHPVKNPDLTSDHL